MAREIDRFWGLFALQSLRLFYCRQNCLDLMLNEHTRVCFSKFDELNLISLYQYCTLRHWKKELSCNNEKRHFFFIWQSELNSFISFPMSKDYISAAQSCKMIKVRWSNSLEELCFEHFQNLHISFLFFLSTFPYDAKWIWFGHGIFFVLLFIESKILRIALNIKYLVTSRVWKEEVWHW